MRKYTVNSEIYDLFKKGSRTYFYSSIFFPSKVRNNVFILYSFVRKADNLVDSIPQNKEGFYEFKNKYEDGLSGRKTNDIIIDSFIVMMKRVGIEKEWVKSFLDSMEADITKSSYKTMKESLSYMYGSAEVVGLMMGRLLCLKDGHQESAKMLGRAMQYINFLRDVKEDNSLGRHYIPSEILEEYNLSSLDYNEALSKRKDFTAMMKNEIKRYLKWQKMGEEGFRYIPKFLLIPIRTASDMYRYTASEIYRDPFVIYRRKVKPSVFRILVRTFLNVIDIY
ncbi:MAG: phytoene/squalene synthase family protein [bacterium]|nr:phytoene/squalene synthase family protein [bacterium]